METAIHLDDEGWNTKLSSWKCGSEVICKFCERDVTAFCNGYGFDGESGTAMSASQIVGAINDSVATIILTPYDKSQVVSATVY